MGSLVPGWDASAFTIPEDFIDISEEPEQSKGYFANYERQKLLRRMESDGRGPASLRTLSAPSLARHSWNGSLSARTPASPTLERMPSGELRVERDPSFTRISTMPVKVTPGEDKASRPDLSKYTTKDQNRSYTWWNKLDSSALNDKPDEVDLSKDKGYVPQYSLTGQSMNYTLKPGTVN